MRRFHVLAVLAIFLGTAFLSGCGGPDDSDSNVLRVGTEGTYAPFSYHDPETGDLTGYDVEVIKAIAEKLGRRVEFVESPWRSIFQNLESERFDVVANQVSVNDERKARYDLTDVYVQTDGVIVVRADDDRIKGVADLSGKTAGQTSTSNWADSARGAGANVEDVDGFTEAVQILKDGRIDFIINDNLAVLNYLAQHPDSGLKTVGVVGEQSSQAFALRKNSPLTADINKGLEDIRADGTLEEIGDKYFNPEPKTTRSTLQLVKDTLWPLAKSAIKGTIPLTIISFALGLVIALAVALARLSPIKPLSWLARFYISLIRGTPLLVQLFIIFFALPQAGITIDPFPAAVIAFSLNVGGYAAEIIRAAILSIPRGQWEAAETIGMSYRTSLQRIILPQALRTAVPPLSNTLISLVKDTSLASTILVTEILRTAQIAAAPSFEFFALYGTAALYYWVICLVLSFGQGKLEHRLDRYIAK